VQDFRPRRFDILASYKILTCASGTLSLELGSLIGEGREGRVYEVVKKNGAHCADSVLKVMFDSATAGHINTLLSSIRTLLSSTPTLACLPQETGYSQDGEFCLLMRKAEGIDLDRLSCDLADLSPFVRLNLAFQIASGIKILHENHTIHADIADANIIVDTQTIRAFIIDIDGGGRAGPQPIRPRVMGHAEWMAPELWDSQAKKLNSNRFPDIETDRWSLAVLIHHVLIGGLHPFFFLDNIYQISTYDKLWPPLVSDFPDQRPNLLYQAGELEWLGGDVDTLLIRAFDAGRTNRDERPSAGQWEHCLGDAIGWYRVCENGHSLVAPGLIVCPKCSGRLGTPSRIGPGSPIATRPFLKLHPEKIVFRDVLIKDVVAFGKRKRIFELENTQSGTFEGGFRVSHSALLEVHPPRVKGNKAHVSVLLNASKTKWGRVYNETIEIEGNASNCPIEIPITIKTCGLRKVLIPLFAVTCFLVILVLLAMVRRQPSGSSIEQQATAIEDAIVVIDKSAPLLGEFNTAVDKLLSYRADPSYAGKERITQGLKTAKRKYIYYWVPQASSLPEVLGFYEKAQTIDPADSDIAAKIRELEAKISEEREKGF
jgi:serine/threonine protein kinase